jgi:phage terminase large subunit
MSLPPLALPKLFDPSQAPNIRRYQDQKLDMQPSHMLRLWRERPKIFFKDMFDFVPDLWQEEVLESYCTDNRVAVVANKGPGKTALLAVTGLHFLSTHHLPKCAALSVTKDHLKDNLWAEMLLWRSKSETLKKSITDGSEKISIIGHEAYAFISARSYPKEADESQMASALAGLHANNVAFFIDEAGSIPDAVLATADAALSTGDSDTKKGRILVTANPERPSGTIYRASLGQTVQKWKVHHVTGDPDDPKRSPRVSKDWAREQIATYGADHPWVLINVFGKYPKTSADQLLSEHEIAESVNRQITTEMVKHHQVRLGIDVARGGADSTVFFMRQGLLSHPPEMVSSDVLGPELASKAMFYSREHKVERVYVDGTGGWGSSVFDHLTTFNSVDVTSVMYNAKAHQDKLYANKRTENWVRMRDWIRKGGKLPNDPLLARELMMPQLYFVGGRFQLEAKEQIKKRLGRSPDRADALSQTFQDVEDFGMNVDFSRNPEADPDRHLSTYDYMQKHRNPSLSKHLTDDSMLDNRHSPSPNHIT